MKWAPSEWGGSRLTPDDLPEWALTRILHLRRLMLIHSYLYYHANDSVVTDHQWQEWADELRELQRASPSAVFIGFYDSAFKDWDGSTGYHLPVDPDIQRVAQRLLLNPHLPRNQRRVIRAPSRRKLIP